jgi:NADH dehydrogenase/NADH:ubiquinone oxidoreductase subunit G
MIFDVPVDFTGLSGVSSRPSDLGPGAFFGTQDIVAALKDNTFDTALIEDDEGNISKDKMQDLVNNTVFQDLRDSTRMQDLSNQQAFDIAINSPNVVWDSDSLSAAAELLSSVPTRVSQTGIGKTRQDRLADMLPELTTQVDTFKDIPDVTAPAGPTPAEIAAAAQAEKDKQAQIAAANAAANALAAANARAKTAAANRAKVAAQKAAAAAQRKANLAAQQAAARRAALARQALKDSQAAAAARQQQQAQQDMIRQANKIMSSKDYMDAGIGGLTRAQLDVLAAANIDTFGSSGGMRNTRGEVGMDETGYTDTSGYGVG